MGRANRKHTGSSGTRSAVRATEAENDYLGLDDYASGGIASEALSTYIPDSRFSEADLALARRTVQEIEEIASDRKRLDDVHKAPLSEKGLRIAEGVFMEIGEDVGGEREISERFDPDGEFLSQSDADHMYALAAYMRAIRENRPTLGHGEGMQDSRFDHLVGIVEQARAIDSV